MAGKRGQALSWGGRALHRLVRPDLLQAPALALAVGFACLSLTPSLVPRSPAFQGLVSGLSAACGYATGVLLLRLGRRLTGWRPAEHVRARARRLLWVVLPLLVAAALAASAGWQREVHELVSEPPPGEVSPLLIVTVAAGLLLALLAGARLLRRVLRVGVQPLSRVLPGLVAVVVSVLLVAVALGAVFDRVVVRVALSAVDGVFAEANDQVPDGLRPPTVRTRSGGPGSATPWHELGVMGRMFVAEGPDRAQLASFHGEAALEPIRVYAGLDTSTDLDELAAVAVRELVRTGAFTRQVLCVVTPTGRGWINPRAAAALEQLYGGDSAIVSMQYSYLPSPLAVLVEPARARSAGERLFEAVHAHWSKLPEEGRPRLLVYGESLGSTGGQAAFRDLDDVRARTDGALFVGPPRSNALWSELVRGRDPGTTQVRPVVDEGRAARFAARADQHEAPDAAAWEAPRVLFLQHASDPVVWWSPALLLRRPDWLREERGPDVSPRMRWYPFVTFWQVSADLVVANDRPVGHGHHYGDFVRHWAAVAPPEGWTAADTARLGLHLSR